VVLDSTHSEAALYRTFRASFSAVSSLPGNQARNDAEARIEWLFTVDEARQKMGRAYPKPTHTRGAGA